MGNLCYSTRRSSLPVVRTYEAHRKRIEKTGEDIGKVNIDNLRRICAHCNDKNDKK